MALSVNNGGGFGSRRRGSRALSEINVTPFVDVVLVLLIIFMLTAHVMEFGIEVDVPKVRQVKESAQPMPVITITKEGIYTPQWPAGHQRDSGQHSKAPVNAKVFGMFGRSRNHLGGDRR
jgi:biopolymer transport protein ExbD